MTNALISYAPDTFLKPCLLISTTFNQTGGDTAVMFIESLNPPSAIYDSCHDNSLKRTAWLSIKKHKTEKEAEDFHIKIFRKFCGRERNIKSWNEYYVLLYKFKKEIKKAGFEIPR